MSSQSVGSIHYDLGLDTSKFDSASAAINNKLGDIGGAFAGFAKKTSLALGAAGAAFTAFSVKGAADFEQTRIGLENMLGSADKAKVLLKDISKFAAETPFEFPELAQATRQLVAFGFSAEDAFKTMKELGDVSAAVGAPINDLAYLMGTLRTQGRAFTIDIRQFAQRGIPIYEYLAKVLKTNEKEISKMIEAGKIGFPEVQKAFAAMTGEGGKFHGTMAKQSRSLTGLFSTLKDVIGQTGRELVGISQDGEVATGSLFDKIRKGTSWLIDNLPAFITSVKELTSELADGFKDFLPTIKQWAENVKDTAEAIGSYLGPKLVALFNTLRKDLIPALAEFFDKFIKPMLPVLGELLVFAIGLVVDYLNLWYKSLAFVIDKINEGNPVIWGLIGLFGTLATAMMMKAGFAAITSAFSILTTVTIPGVMLKVTALQALIASPIGFGAIAVGAALVALAAVKQAAEGARSAIEGASRAAQGAATSNEEVIRKLRAQTKAPYSPEMQARARKTLQALADTGAFATGTSFAPGGMALVGEYGPELVNLPRGSKVFTADKTKNMMGGNSSVNIYGNIQIDSQQDADYFMKRISRNQELELSGLSPL